MPGYELNIVLRVMTKPELVTTLKRTVHEILDRGGFLRRIENLGTRATPFKMTAHGQCHREASYFTVVFEAPAQCIDDIREVYSRDVDVMRSNIFRMRHIYPQECTIFDEMKPPAYRKDVQEMIEIGKRKVKPKFNSNTGLPVTPFQR